MAGAEPGTQPGARGRDPRRSKDLIAEGGLAGLKMCARYTEDRLWRACFVASDLNCSVMRTAVDLPADEAPALIEEYSTMITQHIASLLC